MADPMLQVGAQILCPHAGSVSIISSNTRVSSLGAKLATATDTFSIAGCPFQIPFGVGTKPQPCVTAQWLVPALRVKVQGQAALTSSSSGLCLSVEQIPAGPPSVVYTQLRVKAS